MKLASKLVLGVFTLLALVAFLALVSAAHGAEPACPAGADCSSACGSPATGLHNATGEIVKLSAEDARGLQVGPDGYWRWCVAQPAPPAPKDRPCPGAGGKVWTVDGASCAGADRGLRHGETGYWQAWLGPTRGHMIERCNDGVRTVLGAACAPATHCDVLYRVERDGVPYEFDARPDAARVPLGATVAAVAADGRRWPITCVAGAFEAAVSLPPAPAPSAPRRLVCGPQAFRAIFTDVGASDWRYEGPAVAQGAVVAVVSADGLRTGRATCLAHGRFALQR